MMPNAPAEHVVDHAVGLQQADPRVHAQQERGPERQDDQHQEHVALGRRRARDGVGHRIAEQQAEQRGEERDLDRVDPRADVQRLVEQVDVAAEQQLDLQRALFEPLEHRLVRRAAERRELREGDLEDDEERDQEEDQQPQVRHGDDQPLARPVLQHVLRPARRTEAEQERPQRAETAQCESRAAMLRPAGFMASALGPLHCVTTTGLDPCQVSHTVSSQPMRSSSDRRSTFGSVTRTILPVSIFTR